MKKTSGFVLLILFLVLIHVAGFVLYDLYYDPLKNLTISRSDFKTPVSSAKKNQNNHQDFSKERKYASNRKNIKPEKFQSERPQIYSWIDSSGVTHFSNREPQNEVRNLQKSNAYVSKKLGSSEMTATRMDPYLSSSSISKIIVKENQIFVPVRLCYREKEVQVMLLLDTGASTTAIHSEAASRLGLWERTKGYSTVADGRKIDTEKAYLDYIQVGPIKIKNFQVSIINYSGNNDNYTGLLGMNFLKRAGYTIDYSRQVIKWE